MTVTVPELAVVLEDADEVDEWVIRAVEGEVLSLTLGASDVNERRRRRIFEVTAFVDRRQTRGEASFALGPADRAALEPALAAAVTRAKLDRGPLWRLPPPSAPARVKVADPSLSAEPAQAIATIAAALGAAERGVTLSRARIQIESSRTRVATSVGFDRLYDSSRIDLEATLIAGSPRLRVAAQLAARARRLADLDLEADLEAAAARLRARAGADPTPLGDYDLIVDAAALERARGAGRAGWLDPLAAQASGALARRSLSRYQPGQSIYGEAELTGDALTLHSDGAADFALESAPFADRGEPIRRFALIEAGVAAGLSLDAREAALRGLPANGGARNLVLATGSRDTANLATGERPALEITELAWLEIEPESGAIAAEIALAYRQGADGGRHPVSGGHVVGNVFDWLPRMRLDAAPIRMPGYTGPRWIGWPDVAVR